MANNNKKELKKGYYNNYNIEEEYNGYDESGKPVIDTVYSWPEGHYRLQGNGMGGYGQIIRPDEEGNEVVEELNNYNAPYYRGLAEKAWAPKQQSEFWKWAGRKWREAKAAGRAVKTLLGFQHGGRLVKMNGKLIEVPFENK